MLPKLNSTKMALLNISVKISSGLIIILFSTAAFGADVTSETALQVAQGVLRHHIALFGDWNGETSPMISDVEKVAYEKADVAYNFKVYPTKLEELVGKEALAHVNPRSLV